MSWIRLLGLAVASAVLTAPLDPGPAQQPRPAAQRDWSRTIAATPEGGFRMGNPGARVKVIEYLSLTCPHCAEFARDGTPLLISEHVRRGQVSLEYRHFVLNGVDMTASLLARCGGTARYFGMVEQILASQDQWMTRFERLSAAQRSQINALPPAERFVRIADLTGLGEIAARNGIGVVQARRCLADQGELNRLGEMYQAASALGVNGTPTFLINGTMVEPNIWPSLEPLIRRAGP